MIERIFRVWPVPVGHNGLVVDPQSKVQDWVEVKYLVGAGFLNKGAKLHNLRANHSCVEATITSDGHIELAGKKYCPPPVLLKPSPKEPRTAGTSGRSQMDAASTSSETNS